jgi:hypothetical protein
MKIPLSKLELQQFVQTQVNDGRFDSAEAVAVPSDPRPGDISASFGRCPRLPSESFEVLEEFQVVRVVAVQHSAGGNRPLE